MGLAASQARLLFITMRQNDVSAKMQKISNDKLVLARDEEEVSEKYNNMLNNPNYTYTNSDGTSISYDSLMGQTAAVNGVTNVITNGEGKVVLSPSLASTLGISAAEGSAKDFRSLYPKVEDLIKAADPDNADKINEQLSNVTVQTSSATSSNGLTNDDKQVLDNTFRGGTYGEYPTKTVKTTAESVNLNGALHKSKSTENATSKTIEIKF